MVVEEVRQQEETARCSKTIAQATRAAGSSVKVLRRRNSGALNQQTELHHRAR